MKKDYSTPKWKLVLIQASDILSDSIEVPDGPGDVPPAVTDDPWSKDY